MPENKLISMQVQFNYYLYVLQIRKKENTKHTDDYLRKHDSSKY